MDDCQNESYEAQGREVPSFNKLAGVRPQNIRL